MPRVITTAGILLFCTACWPVDRLAGSSTSTSPAGVTTEVTRQAATPIPASSMDMLATRPAGKPMLMSESLLPLPPYEWQSALSKVMIWSKRDGISQDTSLTGLSLLNRDWEFQPMQVGSTAS